MSPIGMYVCTLHIPSHLYVQVCEPHGRTLAHADRRGPSSGEPSGGSARVTASRAGLGWEGLGGEEELAGWDPGFLHELPQHPPSGVSD